MQVAVLAATEKGELTVAPFAGAVTVMAEAVTIDTVESEVGVRFFSKSSTRPLATSSGIRR